MERTVDKVVVVAGCWVSLDGWMGRVGWRWLGGWGKEGRERGARKEGSQGEGLSLARRGGGSREAGREGRKASHHILRVLNGEILMSTPVSNQDYKVAWQVEARPVP